MQKKQKIKIIRSASVLDSPARNTASAFAPSIADWRKRTALFCSYWNQPTGARSGRSSLARPRSQTSPLLARERRSCSLSGPNSASTGGIIILCPLPTNYYLSIQVDILRWTGDNEYFLRGEPDGLVVGSGDGKFALWVDADLNQVHMLSSAPEWVGYSLYILPYIEGYTV